LSSLVKGEGEDDRLGDPDRAGYPRSGPQACAETGLDLAHGARRRRGRRPVGTRDRAASPHGPADLAALLSRRHDAAALAALPDPAALKIRERIRVAVLTRVEAAHADAAALRRWAGWLALPVNLPLALRLVWESADRLWRWAGDVATDENHYSKRAILAGILISAISLRMSAGGEATERFVDARIGNVMSFEKWKAGIKPGDLLSSLVVSLGRLRYGQG